LLRCFAFQSHIQNRWAMQHGKIIIQKAQTVIQCSGSYDILLTTRFRTAVIDTWWTFLSRFINVFCFSSTFLHLGRCSV